MKRLLAITIATLALSACKPADVKPYLDNLSHDCTRHYTFSLSTGGVAGVGANSTITGNIDCAPELVKPAASGLPASVPPAVVPALPAGD